MKLLGQGFLFLLVICYFTCMMATMKTEKSSNYYNGSFRNTGDMPAKSIWQFLKTRLTHNWSDWPSWRAYPEGVQPPKIVGASELRVTFINHATLLIQSGGYNILTDPHYSKRCSPLSFLGPQRVHSPGILFEKLPKIDFIIISHDHYDHLDLPTIERLVKRDQPQIFVGIGLKARIIPGANVVEMDWWESITVSDHFQVHFVETQHFSGRTLWDRNTTLWGGFVLELSGRKIYFGGDSGYASHYKRTYEKFGAMDLALLPIGAYAPRDFMGPMHIDPQQAVQAHRDLMAQKSIGMHFGTFQLTAEPIDEPVTLLREEAKKMGLKEDEFVALKPGQFLVFK